MTQLQAKQVSQALRKLANREVAKTLSSFFKTGKGEYGEGDKFLGIKVPQSRDVAKKYAALPLSEIAELAKSAYHEERFTAVVILVNQFKKQKTELDKKKYFDFYLKLIRSGAVNNWDLVDVSAPYLGEYLATMPDAGKLLNKLARSKNLWEQRTSVMLTWPLIRRGNSALTFDIVEYLIDHPHDLIHKACGWMLREVGKRDVSGLNAFLARNAAAMPRVMLRYAIERMPEKDRKKWLTIRK